MCQKLILSKLSGSTDNTIVVSDIAGQASALVGYISVEAINKSTDQANIRWTHMGFKTYGVKVTNTVSRRSGQGHRGQGRVVAVGVRTAESEYEHEATFDTSKITFDSGDDYMVRISSNVKRVIKSKDKIVWFSEIKGHPDLDIALNLDIYRI